MSTSSQTSGTGIFAKLVAKFLVKWVKKSVSRRGSAQQPALSSTPSTVTGRPDRDRSRETFGDHTGSSGPREQTHQAPVTAIQGDDYGAHRGTSGTTVTTADSTVYDPAGLDRRLAAMWAPAERDQRGEALRGADPATLREAGLSDRQVAQAGAGRVPSGYQLERVPASGDGDPQYRLTPVSEQGQHNCHHVNREIFSLQIGDTTVISFPIGGRQITVVLGLGAAMAG